MSDVPHTWDSLAFVAKVNGTYRGACTDRKLFLAPVALSNYSKRLLNAARRRVPA